MYSKYHCYEPMNQYVCAWSSKWWEHVGVDSASGYGKLLVRQSIMLCIPIFQFNVHMLIPILLQFVLMVNFSCMTDSTETCQDDHCTTDKITTNDKIDFVISLIGASLITVIGLMAVGCYRCKHRHPICWTVTLGVGFQRVPLKFHTKYTTHMKGYCFDTALEFQELLD